MPVHRVPRSTLPETIDKLEASGLDVLWPPICDPQSPGMVDVYTRPDRRLTAELQTRGAA